MSGWAASQALLQLFRGLQEFPIVDTKLVAHVCRVVCGWAGRGEGFDAASWPVTEGRHGGERPWRAKFTKDMHEVEDVTHIHSAVEVKEV
jgi:hypothetical protein